LGVRGEGRRGSSKREDSSELAANSSASAASTTATEGEGFEDTAKVDLRGDGGGDEGDVLAVREGELGGVGKSLASSNSELVVSLKAGWALATLGEEGGD
jgi:hypothetical protein